MLRSRIPQIAAELGPQTRAAQALAAELVVARARQRVPVATGRLRDAIHVEEDETGVHVVAGDQRVFYGHLVEHGGAVNRPAHPFLIPALEETQAEIVRMVAEALQRAAE
jgi:HK97 gp10 family phage protein